MKVSRNSEDQLILDDTPWFLGIALILFILAFVGPGVLMMMDGVWQAVFFILGGGGLGGLAFVLMIERVQVIFDRPSGSVTLRRRSVLRYRQVRHELSDVSKAVLQSSRSAKGGTTYRPALVLDRGMSAGVHPVITVYTNGRGPRRAVEAINAWLQVTPDEA